MILFGQIVIGVAGGIVLPMWAYVEWLAWHKRLPSVFGPMPPKAAP